jgi:hypothetical protein
MGMHVMIVYTWCCCFIGEPRFFPLTLLVLLSMVTRLGGGHWQWCCFVHRVFLSLLKVVHHYFAGF